MIIMLQCARQRLHRSDITNAGMIHACPPTMPLSRLISRDHSFLHLFDSSVSKQTIMSVIFQYDEDIWIHPGQAGS